MLLREDPGMMMSLLPLPPGWIGHPRTQTDLSFFLQTLKERFAELLPEKIEEIKTLRK